MAQHDYVIGNDSGANVRADINNLAAAVVSNNSGSSAPATTFAYQWWADTTNGVLKQRNASNSAWVIRANVSDDLFQTKSGAYTILVSDYGRIFSCTSSFTFTLTAAATLGDGFWFSIRNFGTGVITVDANASETIDGALTLQVFPGESCTLYCDGVGFLTTGLSRVAQIGTISGSNVTGLSLSSLSVSPFRKLVIHMMVQPLSAGAAMNFRLGTAGVYLSGATDYIWASLGQAAVSPGTVSGAADDAHNLIILTGTTSATANQQVVGDLHITTSSVIATRILADLTFVDSSNSQWRNSRGMGVSVIGPHDSFQVFASTGNITGSLTAFGFRT